MSDKNTHVDQLYIDGLKNNDPVVINAIYKKFVPKVIQFIKNNNGSADEAEDVIQEVLIIIFKQAREESLTISCPFDAYFFLLCKRRWLNELKKSSRKGVTLQNDNVSKDESLLETLFKTEMYAEKQALFEKMFQQLGEKCQEILKLSFIMKSMEEVAQKLAVTYAYVRKKKSLCTGQLTKLIKESVQYQSLKNQ
ncbi:RNA polymerase subunit sigma-24 [Flavobacterium sp. 9AF]|uniref:RNA polymerase sigma factor n=1 Tax=Flavobacterium sp. 9AF TaxID=2653142 RepID=UPI0012F0AF9B|nr:sigma-70 family RNA polymerase sigma factor [Flavobacterium sp. 9AF]VXB27533.1 RNA polymerase subunit sigma-24 [Flavobacterium sp. 9AF]